MGAMGKEMESLRAQAAEASDAKKQQKRPLNSRLITKFVQGRDGVAKKYWNMMEDMKGKFVCIVVPDH